ncbi:MAG: TorD/DmsD family molecular chaperone [Candidatus Rokuibacteriota bacterium]
MIGDPEVLAFRRGYYDLFVALLWREPAPDLVAGLTAGLEERIDAARAVHPALGEGWDAIGAFLAATPRDAVADVVTDEYTRVFLGPQRPPVYPYESYYLTGRVLDRPLAAVRGFLREVGLAREADFSEPEDHLAFELEVMRRLLARQAGSPDADGEARWLRLQGAFLRDHLLVWGPAVSRDLAAAEGAAFYRGVGRLLEGFLDLERDVAREWSQGEVPSLQDARRRAAATPEFRGPVTEFGGTP